jgi:hypothetical protein
MEKVDGSGRDWRAEVKSELSHLDIQWMDPTCKNCDIGCEDEQLKNDLLELRSHGAYDLVYEEMSIIRRVDRLMVSQSDFVIVRIDPDVPTFGTHEEVVLARQQEKPILVWIPRGKQKAPLWWLGMIPDEWFFGSITEIKTYLGLVDSGLASDPHRRWIFVRPSE